MNNSSFFHEPKILEIDDYLKKLDELDSRFPIANEIPGKSPDRAGLDSLIKNMRSNSDALEQDIVQNRKQNDSLISDIIKFDEEKENLSRKLDVAKTELSKSTKRRDEEEEVIKACIKEKNFMDDPVMSIKQSEKLFNEGCKGIEFL